MQHVKNAIGWNAMKMLKMHQNAAKCTRMRMGKNPTTFGKKTHESPTIRRAHQLASSFNDKANEHGAAAVDERIGAVGAKPSDPRSVRLF